ncbi:hypothetical protein ACET3Z_012588 [Daucus carota]
MAKQSATTKETNKAAEKAKKMKKLSEINTPDVLKKKCASKAVVVKMKDVCRVINRSPEGDVKKMKMLSQVETPDVLKKKFSDKTNEALETKARKMKRLSQVKTPDVLKKKFEVQERKMKKGKTSKLAATTKIYKAMRRHYLSRFLVCESKGSLVLVDPMDLLFTSKWRLETLVHSVTFTLSLFPGVMTLNIHRRD